jgi:DNA-binding winged helix-turn-helix (wHTH) protein
MRFRGPCFEFDSATGEVCRDGAVHRLEPQPAALLALLMSRPGELVTRQQAIQVIWGQETTVSFPDSLHYSVRQIRLALGDQARQPRFVETIPRRGYRFLAEAPLRQVNRQQIPGTPAKWVAAAVVLVMLAGAIVAVERRPNRHHEIAVAILKSVHDRFF